jgi:hypothetical protein
MIIATNRGENSGSEGHFCLARRNISGAADTCPRTVCERPNDSPLYLRFFLHGPSGRIKIQWTVLVASRAGKKKIFSSRTSSPAGSTILRVSQLHTFVPHVKCFLGVAH